MVPLENWLVHPFHFNEFSNSILRGVADISHLTSNDREMAYPHGEDESTPVSAKTSAEDFKVGFKLVLEKTSSSPSDRHVDHYWAALQLDPICLVYSILMSLPFEYGFMLER